MKHLLLLKSTRKPKITIAPKDWLGPNSPRETEILIKICFKIYLKLILCFKNTLLTKILEKIKNQINFFYKLNELGTFKYNSFNKGFFIKSLQAKLTSTLAFTTKKILHKKIHT